MKKFSHKFTAILLCMAALAGMAAIALIPAWASITSGTGNAVYYDQCDTAFTSLAEALESIGIDHSRNNRTAIAAANGIDGYTGTRAQDAILLNLLKNGKLVQTMPSPVAAPAARTKTYINTYNDIAKITDKSNCGSMQGLAVGSTYLYTVKIGGSDSNAFISMTNKDTGAVTTLTNSATGTNYFTYLGHANDMDVCSYNSKSHLFVATMKSGSNSLVRLERSGNSLSKFGSYTLTLNGSNTTASGIVITQNSGGTIKFLTKSGRNIYSGSISASATSGTVALKKEFTLDYTNAYVNGTLTDLSDYVNQGFGYHDGKIFVPVTGPSGKSNQSVILVFDIEKADGPTLYPDRYLSFRITSSTYSALFEIESCGISNDGVMYFNTNRRKSSSDTNHDGVHSFKVYVYEDF